MSESFLKQKRGSVRREPYPMDAVNPERWRRYWIGKKPSVKAAVEEYLAKYATPEHVKITEIALKHGVTEMAMRINIKKMAEANIVPGPHSHLGPAALEYRKRKEKRSEI